MDTLKQRPSLKVRILCASAAHHEMFPKGITVGKLYKNYGIRLMDGQQTAAGYDWDAAERKMKAMMGAHGLALAGGKTRITLIQSDVDMFPCYQLTAVQMSFITCKECTKAAVDSSVAPEAGLDPQ